MYLDHFGLKDLPFTLTPNTQFFCNLPGHQEAMNVLIFSLKSGEGFIKITGEVGMGKTLLCRMILNELDDSFITAYLPNPDLSPQGLRCSIAKELNIRSVDKLKDSEVLDKITAKLLALRKKGKRVVLICDEVQAMPEDTLEALRLLTNLETESEKLLQIVMFGQPELDTRLNQKHFRQLKQRITFSHTLNNIGRDELEEYLCHRLSIAGHTKGSLFEPKAKDALYHASEGTPRLINILCHKALLSAYGRGIKSVDETAMNSAIRDTNDDNRPAGNVITRAHKGFWIKWAIIACVVGAFMVAYAEYIKHIHG